jgi:hypothetical protein
MEMAAVSGKPDRREAALAPGAGTPPAARASPGVVKAALTTFTFHARPLVFLGMKGM